MGNYNIAIKKSAAKELNAIPRYELKKILSAIQALSDNPRPSGCIKLSSREQYRIRIGNYRILYSIEDDILMVYIVKIGHRKDIYR